MLVNIMILRKCGVYDLSITRYRNIFNYYLMRHCEEGRRPDVAIQNYVQIFLDCFVTYVPRNDNLKSSRLRVNKTEFPPSLG